VTNLLWFAVGISIGIAFMLVVLLINLKKDREIHTFDQESISELIGKIQHVTSVNVDTLERKIAELKSTIRDANVVYMKLNEAISDAKNISTSLEGKLSHKRIRENPVVKKMSFEKMEKNGELTREKVESIEKMEKAVQNLDASVKVLSRDEKILDLNGRGWSVEKIAESLNMGVGEVSLIIEMNSHFQNDLK